MHGAKLAINIDNNIIVSAEISVSDTIIIDKIIVSAEIISAENIPSDIPVIAIQCYKFFLFEVHFYYYNSLSQY